MPDVSRRVLLGTLASTGAAALAGCAGVEGPSDAGTALSYELTLDRIGESLAPRYLWEPPETDEPPHATRTDLVKAAAAGERPTTYGYAPIPDDEYVEFDGTYYALDVVATDLKRIERSVLTCSWVGDVDDLDDPPEYVRHEDLPPLDRHAIKPAFFAARARESGGGAPWDLIEEGGYVYRRLEDGRSELAPTPEHDYVRFNDVVLEVHVDRVTLAEPAYTGVRIPVAESREAFERALDAEHVDARVDPADLSEAARNVLARQRYQEATPLSEAFRTVLTALGLRDYLDADPDRPPAGANGRHLAYDGAYYRFGLWIDAAD